MYKSIFAALVLAAGTSSAFAASIVVNSTGDTGDTTAGDGTCGSALPNTCTLRAAIQEANGTPAADVITFSVAGPTTLLTALPDITQPLTIDGSATGRATYTVDGNGIAGLVRIPSGATTGDYTLLNLVLTGGTTANVKGGGAVFFGPTSQADLTLTNVTLEGNDATAGPGGGLAAELLANGSSVDLNAVTIEGNSAAGGTGNGGGIWLDDVNTTGTLTLDNSSVEGNTAAGTGGGIHVVSGRLSIGNSTIAANDSTGQGDGIFAASGGSVQIDNSTISGNLGDGIAIGAGSTSASRVTFTTITGNTTGIRAATPSTNFPGNAQNPFTSNIVGGNTTNCTAAFAHADPLNSGYNLTNGATCGFTQGTDKTVAVTTTFAADAKIAALASNPSAPQTHALLTGSPAIDGGNPTWSPVKDQRGADAQDGGANPNDGIFGDDAAVRDIGAYEFGGFGIVQFSLPNFDVDEDNGPALVVIKRYGTGTAAATAPAVSYSTSPGTATQGACSNNANDYTAVAGPVTANPMTFTFGTSGATQFEQIASMTICNDTTAAEPAETFNISLADVSGGDAVGFDYGPNQTNKTVTIHDIENGVFQFNPLAYNAAEGNPGSNGSATLTVTRTGGSDGAVRVNYATSSTCSTACTATPGTDYTATTSFVDFADGETSKTITINFVGDTAFESGANETFEVTLSGVACQGLTAGQTCEARLNGTAANLTARVTINNDDTAQAGTLQFGAATYTAQETGGTLTVTVKRVGGADGAIAVSYDATDLSATEGATGDYYLSLVSPGPYTLNWADNDSADKTITVNLVNDANTVESNKRFRLDLSAPTNGATLDPVLDETVVTIVSDEQPQFEFADTTLSVAEGSAIAPQLTWTSFSGDDVTVTYATQDGTATAPADYIGVAATVLTIKASDASPRTLAGINTTGGDAAEANETFTVVLSAPTNGAQLGADNPTTVTIVDPPGARFTTTSFTRANEQNAQTITVSVERIGDTSLPLSVDFAITQDCATPPCATQGTDYTRSGGFTGTLSWAGTNANATESSTKTFDITVIGDTAIEGDEGIKLTLSNATTPGVGAAALGTPSTATAVIPDDDYRFEVVETSPLVVAESGGTATVTVRRFGSTLGAASVNYATANGQAVAPDDYTAASGTLNWAAGVGGTQTATITIAEDAIDEANENFTFTLSSPSNNASGEASTIVGPPFVVQIADNDTAGATVTHSGGTTAVAEGGTTDQYTLVLTSQPTADVTITVTGDSQATAAPTSLTFTPANWNVAQAITVTAVNDSIAEGTHSATITHTFSSSDSAYNALSIANVTASVTDNDTAGVTVTQSGGSTAVAEGGANDTYTLVLISQPTANVTITPNGGTQLTVAPATVTFTTANWNVAQTVTVTAVNDAVAEGAHGGSVTHTVTSSDATYNGRAVTAVAVTIADNDTGGIIVTQSGGSTAVTEGGATDTLTVVLGSQPTATVTITAAPGAQLAVAPTTLTFTSANWNVPQTVTVSAVDDANVEDTHSGSLGGTATSADPAYNGSLTAITVTITDNDSVAPGEGVPGVVVTPSGNVASTSGDGGGGAFSLTALFGLLGLAGFRRRSLAAVLALLCAPAMAQTPAKAPKAPGKAKLSYSTADLRYLVVSVDDPSVDATGFALAGSFAMNPNVFVTASFGTVETDELRVAGVVGSSRTDTLAVGIGGHYPINPGADLVGALNILSASAEGQGGFSGSTDETGWGLEAGVRGLWDPKVEWSAMLGYVSIFDDGDTALNLQTQYRVTRNWGVLAGVGLGTNATQMNIGARYNF